MGQDVVTPWDGVERRIEQAPADLTGLSIADRLIDAGKREVGVDDVRPGDLDNAPLKILVDGILDAVRKRELLNAPLSKFKAEYDKLSPDLQAKCPWEVAQTRLLENDGEKLKLAHAMEQGGVLFGVDKDGKLLFADKGDEPIMKGMNYKDTRDRVLFKHDRLDKEGKMELDEEQKPISTGYTMFPYSGDYDKSEEILQYESFTGYHFIRPFRLKRFLSQPSDNGPEWRSSWLESEEDPLVPRFIQFNPSNCSTGVSGAGLGPLSEDPDRGVRRLLRV